MSVSCFTVCPMFVCLSRTIFALLSTSLGQESEWSSSARVKTALGSVVVILFAGPLAGLESIAGRPVILGSQPGFSPRCSPFVCLTFADTAPPS